MAVGDPAVKTYIDAHAHLVEQLAPVVGALLVVIAGKMLARRRGAPPPVAAAHADVARREHAALS